MADINFEADEDFQVLVRGEDKIPEDLTEKTIPAEFKDLDKEALVAKLEAERKTLEETKQKAEQVAALKEGIASLGTTLQKPAPVAVPQPVMPQKSEEDYKEEFNEKFVEDPYSAMIKFQAEKLAPEIQRLMLNNLKTSRKFLELDPERKDTYKKYQDAIEQEILKTNPQMRLEDPEIYQKTHDRVMAGHINEIIEAKVKEALELQAKEKKEIEKKVEPGYTEFSMTSGPKEKPNYVILTQEEKQKANLLGIPIKEYARYLKERGKK